MATNHKAQTVVQKFNSLRGEHSFPGVFGAIDGCHISILAPWEKRTKMPKLNRTMFYNRKQVPTVLLQGIVDSDLKFIDCFAGWPGSSHDARVFRRSIIGEKLLSQPCVILPPGCHILGDGAYPLTSTLMVPFKDNGHLSDSQLKFNKCLSSSRVVIEQAFRKLIGRFRKLKHMDIYHKENCSKVITAACCLHNLCIDNSDDFNSTEIYTSEMEDGNHHEDDSLSGNVKRQELCQQLSLIL
ncbi:protein ALP1-like [Acyrthosiphon pisum]|uniref:DDE Tnp4 domain-containing protein n=1 Tax=Acyrthosiphon pisum TaxID=7029 RepID=A0A8R2F9H6_ACYPI|nr:protein ALP1-like [Acyrthosiphon pisum]|eukprot:XP_008184876.1 PREDICTED: uncharacterized protein LOC100568913 [Acyrthosiphon pisum]